MKKARDDIYGILHSIYAKHLRRHKENPDSKQMCCMWSTDDPPDIIEGTEPICDIEANGTKIRKGECFWIWSVWEHPS